MSIENLLAVVTLNEGPTHDQISLRFQNPSAQPARFRVEVYAGAALAKASVFFLVVAGFFVQLMK